MSTIQTLIDATATGSVYALMAVGIGLVFGVLRLVNFAYGQLVMAGGYALALTNNLNPAVSILVCFAVVIGLTMTLDLVAFRPLRRASPATMLVATFAISCVLPSTGSWPFTSGVYLDSAVFALVILVLLVRPDGVFVRRSQGAVERV